jgi:hypothetical protein
VKESLEETQAGMMFRGRWCRIEGDKWTPIYRRGYHVRDGDHGSVVQED